MSTEGRRIEIAGQRSLVIRAGSHVRETVIKFDRRRRSRILSAQTLWSLGSLTFSG